MALVGETKHYAKFLLKTLEKLGCIQEDIKIGEKEVLRM
jgi:hypothetical protein